MQENKKKKVSCFGGRPHPAVIKIEFLGVLWDYSCWVWGDSGLPGIEA